MDDVGAFTIAFVCIALMIAALSEIALRRWWLSTFLGILGGQAFFLWWSGPLGATEMLFPLLYSAVPALIGAGVIAIVMKRRGMS